MKKVLKTNFHPGSFFTLIPQHYYKLNFLST
mgnify:CR=1